MKLADILYEQGFGTRYDCRMIASSGSIVIAGKSCEDPDEQYDPNGLVLTYRGERWPVVSHALIAMNKPAGYECSMKPTAHPSVMSLLPGQLRRRNVQPVGRLDVDTTGLLLFTDDGVLQHRLIHPKRHVSKVYEVTLKHPATLDLCEKLLDGVMLDGEPKSISAKSAELLAPQHLRLTLTQGKYHQVKRMVAACSNRVEALHRSGFGRYVLPKDLQPGEWVWILDKTEVTG